nr:hypothetical protein [Tanacetum cinerariifolium]
MPPKPDLVFHTAPIAVETDHSAFTVQLSPSKPAQDLSHTNRPTAPIIEDWVSDSEDESKTKAPQIIPSFVQPFEQVKTPRHSVQPVETSIPAATPKPTRTKSNSSGKRRNRKTCFVCKSVDHLIKNLLTQSKPISITTVRPVSADVPKIMVTQPRLAHPIVIKSKSPIRGHITRSHSPKTSNSPLRVTAVQAPVGNPQYALKDKEVIDSGCSRHIIGNMSYLSDFEELNGRYVAFGGNPKGGKNSGKGKINTGHNGRRCVTDERILLNQLEYTLPEVKFLMSKSLHYGESNAWNHHFRFHKIQSEIGSPSDGRLFKVNGKPIFIRDGNWILS